MFDQKWLKRYMLQNRPPNGEDGLGGSLSGAPQQALNGASQKAEELRPARPPAAPPGVSVAAPSATHPPATSEPKAEVLTAYEVKCPNCGNVYMSDANFCRKCGHKRVEANVVVPRPPTSEANNRRTPSDPRRYESEVQRVPSFPGQQRKSDIQRIPSFPVQQGMPAMSPSPMGHSSARQFGPPAVVDKFGRSGEATSSAYPSASPPSPQNVAMPQNAAMRGGGEVSAASNAPPWPMMGGGFFGPYAQFPYDANANMYSGWPASPCGFGNEAGVKHYVVLCNDDVELRASPTSSDDARIGHLLNPGQVVVIDERRMVNGTWFLHLADGRGWVFETIKRLLVMTEVQEFERGLWHYSVVCEDDVETRMSPTYSDEARTGVILCSGDCVAIDERCQVAGARFLKLADGRGWVFETRDRLLVFSEVRSKPQEARDFERGLWHYTVVCDDDVEIRAAPTYSDEARTGLMLHPGDCVAIDERCRVAAVWYLRLADGRGWVFESKDSRRVMMQLH